VRDSHTPREPIDLSVHEKLDILIDGQADLQARLDEIHAQLDGTHGGKTIRELLEQAIATLGTLTIWVKRRPPTT